MKLTQEIEKEINQMMTFVETGKKNHSEHKVIINSTREYYMENISKAIKEYILKEIIKEEEPQHPSGMDREKIIIRNEHRDTQRVQLEEDFK